MASVARACAEDVAGPLDGIAPQAVAESVRVALGAGLVDDLDWLSSASAGAALYEVAAVLPSGNEKRELGRRVLARLLEGDASAFVALATRMALGSGRGLGGEAVRARVSLASAMPSVLGVRSDALSLALISRRELVREWVSQPSTGALADRRLAGRLIEQAARAIARRASQGDDRAVSTLRGEAMNRAWQRLLDDREPLVWRHVAVARGLLAPFVPTFLHEIEFGLDVDRTPTEWRRAAASLGALAASRPDDAARRLREAVSRGLFRRDPGVASSLLWGVPAAAEVEPEAAEALLEAVVEVASPMVVAEALPWVLTAGPGGTFGRRAAGRVRDALLANPPSSGRWAPGSTDVDDGAVALRGRLLADLGGAEVRPRSIIDATHEGLRAFAERGARQAFAFGLEALEIARGDLSTLEALDERSSDGRGAAVARRASYAALRELDAGLLEDSLAHELLVLGLRSPEAQRALEEVVDIGTRVATYVIERESAPVARDAQVPHRTLRLHRLRVLLHLADERPAGDRDDGKPHPASLERAARIANVMLRHLVAGPPPVLHRIVCATFARAIDALLRDESCDAADVVLWLAQRGLSADDVSTIAEASMNRDLRPLVGAFAQLLRAIDGANAPGDRPSRAPDLLDGPDVAAAADGELVATRLVEAVSSFAQQIGGDASARIEAMRVLCARMGRSLAKLLALRSLGELQAAHASAEAGPVRELEDALAALAQAVAGARLRLGDRAHEGFVDGISTSLSPLVEAALGHDAHSFAFSLASAREELSIALPPFVVAVVFPVVERIASLPARSDDQAPASEGSLAAQQLPAWLPRRRTLGGFYVVRALGAGTGGTVFLARRIEDRHDESAERFALKVPDYDGNAARALSETQFLQLFRDEATALLNLPAHPNLARFVTFDLAARPKPILVMEVVDGVSLERAILAGGLDLPRCFDILDGMLAGLEAMHAAGVGHLDVKPSNVILRSASQPVLVDFGLSGRHIRPGCATLPYGAPEIWGVTPDGHEPEPPPADVYAFGCLAFEVLTSHELFDAATEMALVDAHLGHDGWPERLALLASNGAALAFCEVLARCLRHDPRQRATAAQIRLLLRQAAAGLRGAPWPLGLPSSG